MSNKMELVKPKLEV